ncbi:MAG: DUF3990 domain-containing protein [Clostridiales bacterium]|nr:DUF3990 domain-containing protein [Clostridiales bacterium]
MNEIIYHGSKDIIKTPIYGAGKPYNDYGRGFYCTQSLEMAKEWAVEKDRDGYANKYQISTEGLNILDLNDSKYTFLHWLTILLTYRTFNILSPLANEARDFLIKNFRVSLDGIDIVLGYRADDSYFSYAQDFINGTISYRQLCNALTLGKLGQQFVIISKRAFDKIEYLGSEKASALEWYPKKEIRDKMARNDYFNSRKNTRQKGDIYITTILDEEIKPDDTRLR